MSAHTPGPWEAGRPGHGSIYAAYSNDATGSIIAMCQHDLVVRSHGEMVANAHLIAAAPDLLEAVKAFILADNGSLNGKPIAWSEERLQAAYQIAKDALNAALAKAKGGTS